MHRGHEGLGPPVREKPSAVARDAERGTHHGLRRGGAEGDNQVRGKNGQLGLEPGPAGGNFAGIRLLVQAALAFRRLEFEVLDRIGHIDVPAVDAGFLQRSVEQTAGGADEWMAGPVLLITRLLADEDDTRGGWAFAEDHLGGVSVKRARLAVRGPGAKRLERVLRFKTGSGRDGGGHGKKVSENRRLFPPRRQPASAANDQT